MSENIKKGGISVDAEHLFPIIKKWLYSDKDIFLREIVSNASDAITKLKRLDSLGEISLPEQDYRIDVVLYKTAGTLTGCGPAYAFVIMQALADGAVACGVDRAHAVKYAELTLSGAAELALSTGKHLEQLKDEVCSPGGSTIEGVHMLEMNGFRGDVMDAVCASFEKTKELG